MSLTSEIQPQTQIKQNDSILNGLDSLLSIVEESVSFHNALKERFWHKIWNHIIQVITFWNLTHASYFALKQLESSEFSDFIRSVDFSQAAKELKMEIPDFFINVAAGEFEAQMISLLTQYEIFSHFLEEDFSERYVHIWWWRWFNIFQSKDKWGYFLKIWEEFIPEDNLRDDYFRSQNQYLFFASNSSFYCYSMDNGSITILEGEFESVNIINNKTYIHVQYPNSLNPTHSEIYCVEDGYSFENAIIKNDGFVFGIVEVSWRVCCIQSSSYIYNWFVGNGNEALKWKNIVQIVDIYSGEAINDVEGVYASHRVINGTLYVFSHERYFEEVKGINTERERESMLVVEHDGAWNKWYWIPKHMIMERIETPQDTIFILKLSEWNYEIVSASQWYCREWNKISCITKIEYPDDKNWGCIIHYRLLDFNGTQKCFKSWDYPNTTLQ